MLSMEFLRKPEQDTAGVIASRWILEYLMSVRYLSEHPAGSCWRTCRKITIGIYWNRYLVSCGLNSGKPSPKSPYVGRRCLKTHVQMGGLLLFYHVLTTWSCRTVRVYAMGWPRFSRSERPIALWCRRRHVSLVPAIDDISGWLPLWK